MYKTLNIDGNDYKLEYTIEASLYAECVSELMKLMADIELAEEKEDLKKLLCGISNIPKTTLTMFYAGLMEHHGIHSEGDGKVPDIQTAKKLLTRYIKDHKNDKLGNFYGIMQMCVEQMGEDGFFNLTGLGEMLETNPKIQKEEKKEKAEKVSGK